ncbi:MAG: 2-oxoacid:acceptor oxidoreductase family protein [Acidobacteriota bacterium]
MSQTSTLTGKKRIEVKLSGFGGQGIVMAGYILGRAAAVDEGRNAVMAQSYGPESRGGSCLSEVVIADGDIDYPRVISPDLVVVLSQDAYLKHGATRPSQALLVIDDDLVQLDAAVEQNRQVLKVPATRLADKLGRRIVLNMVVLGFLSGATGVVSRDALRGAVASSVPKGTEEINLRAFDEGFACGEEAQKAL